MVQTAHAYAGRLAHGSIKISTTYGFLDSGRRYALTYTGDGPCMCLLVSFQHCFNQSRFNNHDQSQVSSNTGVKQSRSLFQRRADRQHAIIVQGAMVPIAMEVVDDAAEELPWAESWQEEWREGDEEEGWGGGESTFGSKVKS